MLEIVKSDLLFSAADTDADGVLECCKERTAGDGCPGCESEYTNSLAGQHRRTAAVEEAGQGRIGGEEPHHQGTEGTADTMYRDGPNRVIHLQLPVNELHREDHQHPCHQPDEHCPAG